MINDDRRMQVADKRDRKMSDILEDFAAPRAYLKPIHRNLREYVSDSTHSEERSSEVLGERTAFETLYGSEEPSKNYWATNDLVV